MHALVSQPRAQPACIPDNENERLSVLRHLALLDTPPLAPFDRVTRLAAKALAVPIVLISLVDEKRQWFLSRVGLAATETSRDVSFCAHSVYECRPLIVFGPRPQMRASPTICWSRAILISGLMPAFPFTHDRDMRSALLCAIDTCTRIFNDGDINVLRDCTFIVEDLIQARERALGSDRVTRQADCQR